MTVKYHPKEWMSIKRRMVCGTYFTIRKDLMFVVRLNYLKIIDINTSKTIHEKFFDFEVKNILHVCDSIYVISKKDSNVLHVITDALDHINIKEVEGSCS